MRKSGLSVPLFLLVCWTGLILAGTFGLVETTVEQQLALKFPTVSGRINRSEVGRGAVSRRGLEIEYMYSVGDRRYHGHRYRYDDHNVTFEWESTIVDHPTGTFHKVYYNPQNPADSLLEPGIDGADLLLLLFALPLDVLTFVLWRAMASRLRDHFGVLPAGGVRIRRKRGETRVPLGDETAVAAAFQKMAVVAFVAAFPIVIVGGFDPSMHLIKTTWAVVLAAGFLSFGWRLFINRSGIYDLCIYQESQTIVLPPAAGRPKPVSVPRNEISGVCLQRRTSTGPSGTYFSFLPALNHNGLEVNTRSMKLITWGWSEAKARSFSQWLSQELGVEFKGIEEELVPEHSAGTDSQ